MAITLIKAPKIVDVGLALLSREITLPKLVWLDPIKDFQGVTGDTVTVRVPSYLTAHTRGIRSGDARVRNSIGDYGIPVTLDTNVYKDVRLTDANQTLDITAFSTQVLNPALSAVARGIEDALVDEMEAATYDLTVDVDEADPYVAAVAARRKLNDARVPFAGRSIVVGSALESAFLLSDRFVKADQSGDQGNAALREARIGRVAGFDVYTSPTMDPEDGIAFHKSAFILCTAAPVVPAGAPYGATGSSDGFAIRVVQVLDSDTIDDILATDAYVGTAHVTDKGTITNGIFVPADAGTEDSPVDVTAADDVFARAVKMSMASS